MIFFHEKKRGRHSLFVLHSSLFFSSLFFFSEKKSSFFFLFFFHLENEAHTQAALALSAGTHLHRRQEEKEQEGERRTLCFSRGNTAAAPPRPIEKKNDNEDVFYI